MGPEALIRRNGWVDRASVGIPYLYIVTAATLAEAEARAGHVEEATDLAETVRKIAESTGLDAIIGPSPAPTPAPSVPLGSESTVVPGVSSSSADSVAPTRSKSPSRPLINPP